MFRRILAIAFVAAFTGAAWADEAKSDKDTKVEAGKEFKLTAVEVTPKEKPDEMGRFEVTLKPAKEATKIKMPGEVFLLGFSAKPAKGGGLEIESAAEESGLLAMRVAAGKENEEGPWHVDPGDVLTHVNGYAVNSLEDVIVATSLAKKKSDVQIVIKDVNTGTSIVFYATAKKK